MTLCYLENLTFFFNLPKINNILSLDSRCTFMSQTNVSASAKHKMYLTHFPLLDLKPMLSFTTSDDNFQLPTSEMKLSVTYQKKEFYKQIIVVFHLNQFSHSTC